MTQLADLARELGMTEAEVEWLVKYGTPANFAQTVSGGLWKRAKHLTYLSNVIVDAVEGRTPYVLVEIPPRFGKSELISKWTPAWYLNRFPQNNVILISYALDFAVQWGRQVRNIIQENEDQLRVGIAKDSQSAQRWYTSAGGRMVSVGAGGPITGIGANLLLVDDPIKNQEEANSQTQRDALWDWWQSTVFTRIEPGGACIVLHTRWNMDDLIGRLLQSEIPWRRVRFPAIAEEEDILGRKVGESLWPERYDETALEQIRKGVSSYWWSALYQQSPTTRDGGYFQRDWFDYTRKPPEKGQVIRFWDLAGTESQGTGDPDYTVGVKLAKDMDGNFTILDVTRFRDAPMTVRDKVRQVAIADGAKVKVWIEQEPGNAGKFLVQQYQRDMDEFVVRGFRATGAKE
jgi:hypothetical protein